MSRASRAARRQADAEVQRLKLEAERTGTADAWWELTAASIRSARLDDEEAERLIRIGGLCVVASAACALLLVAFLVLLAATS